MAHEIDDHHIARFIGEIYGAVGSKKFFRKQIDLLRTGDLKQRMWASGRLAPACIVVSGEPEDNKRLSADIRQALFGALHDNDPVVAANAALSLHFYCGEKSIVITKDTYKLSAQTPKDTLLSRKTQSR